MKTYLIKISAVLFTLLIGISAFVCWNIFVTNGLQIKVANITVSEPSPIPVTPCRLVDEPGGFDVKFGKFVSFKATAYVTGNDEIILDISDVLDCFKPDPTMSAILERNSYGEMYLKTLLENKNMPPENEWKEVDVIVTGTAKISFDDKGYKSFSITPTDIKIISPFKKFEPRGAG